MLFGIIHLQISNGKNNKNDQKLKATLSQAKPFTHIYSEVHVGLLTDSFSISHRDVPPEMAELLHVNRNQQILPILKTDYFNTRLKDLIEVNRNSTEMKINFHFKPLGIGKLRLMLSIEHALKMVQNMGFTKKDVDEVKGLFSDTNVYLLCVTVFVSSVHVSFFLFVYIKIVL